MQFRSRALEYTNDVFDDDGSEPRHFFRPSLCLAPETAGRMGDDFFQCFFVVMASSRLFKGMPTGMPLLLLSVIHVVTLMHTSCSHDFIEKLF
jgi:hypothetical protein